MTAKDVFGWDSFQQVEILLHIEEAIGLKVSYHDMDRLQCVGDLIRAMRSHPAAKGGGTRP